MRCPPLPVYAFLSGARRRGNAVSQCSEPGEGILAGISTICHRGMADNDESTERIHRDRYSVTTTTASGPSAATKTRAEPTGGGISRKWPTPDSAAGRATPARLARAQRSGTDARHEASYSLSLNLNKYRQCHSIMEHILVTTSLMFQLRGRHRRGRLCQ